MNIVCYDSAVVNLYSKLRFFENFQMLSEEVTTLRENCESIRLKIWVNVCPKTGSEMESIWVVLIFSSKKWVKLTPSSESDWFSWENLLNYKSQPDSKLRIKYDSYFWVNAHN